MSSNTQVNHSLKMAVARSRRRKRPTRGAMTTTKNKTKKKPKKRHIVGVGDLVAVRSPIRHITGTVGEVIAVLNKDQVVIKAMGAEYEDYDGWHSVALTYRPRGTTSDGDDKANYTIFVTKVMYRRKELPPKARKPEPVPMVIETAEQLRDALASEKTPKAVHFSPKV